MATVIATILLSASAAPSYAAICSYKIDKQWRDGFVARVFIKNDTDTKIKGWNLSFDLSEDVRILKSWNADIDGRGPYTASSLRWNKKIRSGQSIQFGFIGKKKDKGDIDIINLTGDICDNGIITPEPIATPEPTPVATPEPTPEPLPEVDPELTQNVIDTIINAGICVTCHSPGGFGPISGSEFVLIDGDANQIIASVEEFIRLDNPIHVEELKLNPISAAPEHTGGAQFTAGSEQDTLCVRVYRSSSRLCRRNKFRPGN